MKKKSDCYTCEYRGNVPGDTHSKCNHPDIFNGPLSAAKKLNLRANMHGVKQGWFSWPVNFDPAWLERCDGYKKMEIKK